ncbi:hypothetical protein P154DRAFT_523231 [Amniculicola lignicola CBS 123094]|uniref:Uncharacterized protein n=1 Tax=Amniculicola lignicola CBS 123094 TaxID=1392246 RepID=A0A6A5WC22_9PLEO|nr:hypothetical protein P154DRAFT_523231 [Amniculicola lignicola CBS 123094]
MSDCDCVSTIYQLYSPILQSLQTDICGKENGGSNSLLNSSPHVCHALYGNIHVLSASPTVISPHTETPSRTTPTG